MIPLLAETGFFAASCTKCTLCKTRNSVVFGEGTVKYGLMLVGEAPGEDEDISGRPFVGKAGKLLMEILKAIGLARQDVYIANTLKCRPPENRAPRPEELAACLPYLRRQIECLKPKVILALGSPAASALTGMQKGISSLRGQFYPCALGQEFKSIMIMPTFHPSYLLRDPSQKKHTWIDVQLVQKRLGLCGSKNNPEDSNAASL